MYTWPRGPMDKASAYEAEDCRFDPCRGQSDQSQLYFFVGRLLQPAQGHEISHLETQGFSRCPYSLLWSSSLLAECSLCNSGFQDHIVGVYRHLFDKSIYVLPRHVCENPPHINNQDRQLPKYMQCVLPCNAFLLCCSIVLT